MPDLSKCTIDNNGNYWCMDCKTKIFYRIRLEEPLMVPQEVIGNLFKVLDRDEKPRERENNA